MCGLFNVYYFIGLSHYIILRTCVAEWPCLIPDKAKCCSRHAFRMSLGFSASLTLFLFLIFIMRSFLPSKLTLLRSTCVFLFLRNCPTAYAYVLGQVMFALNVADLQHFHTLRQLETYLACLRSQLPWGLHPIGLFVTSTQRSLVRGIFGPCVADNTSLTAFSVELTYHDSYC